MKYKQKQKIEKVKTVQKIKKKRKHASAIQNAGVLIANV